MTFGTARRSTRHVLGDSSGEFVPRYRDIAAGCWAHGKDRRVHQALFGDVLDWLNDDEAERFTRLRLVEAIDAGVGNPTPEQDDAEDTDAGPADSDAVSECVATLARLQVPTTAGAPAARTALRGNQYRYSNAVVAAAVKRRKELSAAATDAEDFETVVL